MHANWACPRPGDVIGYRRNGQPIRLIGGGAPDPDPDPKPDPKQDPDPDPKPDPKQPPAKPASDDLDAWKSHARTWEQRAKENAKAVERLAEIDKANQTDTEKAVNKARDDAEKATRAEVSAAYNRRIVRAEVKAAAGGKLADPADAARLLDLDSFDVDDNGEVDAKAITKAIDDLVKAKPYLAASKKSGTPSFDGGTRTGTQQSGREVGVAEAHKRFGAPKST